jgi:hypothetical protein
MDRFFLSSADKLADYDASPAGQADEKAENQVDIGRRSSTDRSQCPGSDKAPDDDCVGSSVQLLEACSEQDGKEEGKQAGKDWSLGDGGSGWSHGLRWYTFSVKKHRQYKRYQVRLTCL